MYRLRREHPRSAVRRGRRRLRDVPLEAYFWAAGLLAMAAMDPTGEYLFSLCPLDALGLSICPGCGLGHAVAYLARGEVVASFHAHPLGGPAVLVLLHHIARLVRRAAPHSTCTPPWTHASQADV